MLFIEEEGRKKKQQKKLIKEACRRPGLPQRLLVTKVSASLRLFSECYRPNNESFSVCSETDIECTKMRHSYIVSSFNSKKMKFNETVLYIIYVISHLVTLRKKSLITRVSLVYP